MGNDFFRFRQFTVKQGGAAMKVGMDSVLLGAWTAADNVVRALDAGAGTGLLALMTAQRYPDASIDAVEIDGEACRQAAENVMNSLWNNRIRVICDDFIHYAEQCTFRYDLIVCNPPYFTASLKSPDVRHSIARHNDVLPHGKLLEGAAKLLTPAGVLATVLPPVEMSKLTGKAPAYGLSVKRLLCVHPYFPKPASRILAEWSKTNHLPDEKALYIEKADRSDYTDEYRQLTKDFYLKF